MYERFTDRARNVMQLAQQEAERFKHEYIGTEHIIRGLIIEGSGVAANVLKNLDVDLRKILFDLDKVVVRGPDSAIKGDLLQTPRTKKVIDYSIEEAGYLKLNYVGTEHLLLGLLRDNFGVAALLLKRQGVNLKQVRQEIVAFLGLTGQQWPPEQLEETNETENELEEPSLMKALDALVDNLHECKLAAISEQNWELGARLRDQIEQLKKQIETQKRKRTNRE